MDIRFYLALFFRRLHYVLLFLFLGTAVGVTLALVLPPRYVAQARLVVESEQIPDELASSTVRTEAVEQLQIIRQRILARDKLLDLADQFEIYAREEDEPLQPDEIVDDMRRRITIETTGAGRRNSPEATLVDVSFSAAESRLSAAVANEVVTLILQENVEMRTTVSGQTLDFFQQEVERLDKELAESKAKVVAFQEEHRSALPESLEFRRNQLLAAQERLNDIDRELASLRDRRESLVTLYETTGQVGLEDAEDLSPEARELRRLREKYASSRAVMSDENPRVRVMKKQIEALENIVAQQQGAVTGGSGKQPMSAYDVQLADIDNQIEFLNNRREEVKAAIDELDKTIKATPNNAVTLSTLQRDMENIRNQYDRAVEKRSQAETGDMIESLSKGQRISVIENAIAPAEPNSPDRKKIAVAGVGGGLMLGIGLVLLLELLNTSIRRSRELTDGLEITPIATLSYMRTRGEILRRRAMIASAFLVAIAVIPAGLWAVDTYYMPVDLLYEKILQQLPEIPVLSTTQRASL